MNRVSDLLEALLPILSSFLKDRSNNSEIATSLAFHTREFASAVNDLIILADYSGVQKALVLIQKAREVLSKILTQVSHTQLDLLPLLKNAISIEKELQETACVVVDRTSSLPKKNAVNARAEDVHTQVTKVFVSLQTMLKTERSSQNQNEFDALSKVLFRRYDKLESAVKSAIDHSTEIEAIYQQTLALLRSARDLHLSSLKLMELAKMGRVSSDEFIRTATSTAMAAKKLAEAAEVTLETITDPGRRYQIQQNIQNVLNSATDLIQKAKLVAADPQNLTHITDLENAYSLLDSHVQQLLILTDVTNENLLAKIHFGTKYAHSLSQMLTNPQTVGKNGELIANLVGNITDDAKIYSHTIDPLSAAKIEKNCGNLQQIATLLSASATRWGKSGNESDKADLEKKCNVFQRALQIFRTSVGLDGNFIFIIFFSFFLFFSSFSFFIFLFHFSFFFFFFFFFFFLFFFSFFFFLFFFLLFFFFFLLSFFLFFFFFLFSFSIFFLLSRFNKYLSHPQNFDINFQQTTRISRDTTSLQNRSQSSTCSLCS
jgi:hypothetical protein